MEDEKAFTVISQTLFLLVYFAAQLYCREAQGEAGQVGAPQKIPPWSWTARPQVCLEARRGSVSLSPLVYAADPGPCPSGLW